MIKKMFLKRDWVRWEVMKVERRHQGTAVDAALFSLLSHSNRMV
jgi:hypothetical protein